jgi:ribosomal-protein-alanine N-acetyltransferase
MESILLEVRPTNTRALQVYQRYGYAEIGRRKGYYPAHEGRREDAIVMRYML